MKILFKNDNLIDFNSDIFLKNFFKNISNFNKLESSTKLTSDINIDISILLISSI